MYLGFQQNKFHVCFLTYSASLGARNFILDIFQHPTIDFSTVRERSSITSVRLGGVGVLTQNADTADTLEGGKGSKPKC